MVKLSNEIKNEILEKFKNGSSTGSIMNEYKLSRSTVQRIENEQPLLYEDNTSYASSSKEDMNQLLNDLNDEPVKMNDQKTDVIMNNRIVQDEIIRVDEPVKIDSTFHNIHGKMDIINKLDLFNEKVTNKPVQNQNQPVQQPKQNITVNATDKIILKRKT
jgi:hypothetical protein